MHKDPIAIGLAVCAVLRAAVRVALLERRASLPELVAELRRTPRGFVSSLDPRLLLGVLEALLPFLPPYGAGRCVKRSLLLLDLWSRAGLAPSFHLGVRNDGSRGGHAWVTTREDGSSTFQPPDVAEAWRA
jgi:hypothetical protein